MEKCDVDCVGRRPMRTSLVLAAGLGTRLRPITDLMPKALVSYHGSPLIESLLEKLKKSGFDRVVINVHHFADQVEEFVTKNDGLGLEYAFSDERDLLRDTGGAIRHAEPLLIGDTVAHSNSSKGESTDAQPFLVHNVDIVTDINLKWLYNTATKMLSTSEDDPVVTFKSSLDKEYLNFTMPGSKMPIAVMVVSRRETSRQLLFDHNDRLVGWTNLSTGLVRSPFPSIASLDAAAACRKYRALAYSGIQVISPAIFTLMHTWQEKFSIIDFYLSIADTYIIKALEAPAYSTLTDVGKLSQIVQQ